MQCRVDDSNSELGKTQSEESDLYIDQVQFEF